MLIHDRSAFAAAVESLDDNTPPAIDYETNGLPAWHPGGRIVGISIAGITLAKTHRDLDASAAWYIPLAHKRGTNADPLIVGEFLAWLAGRPIVVFNLAMEWAWTRARFRQDLLVVGDGFLASRLLQRPQKSLKDLRKAVLGRGAATTLSDILGEGCVDFSEANADDPRVADYACQDARDAFDLELVEHEAIRAVGMEAVYQLELLAARIMAQQELQGYLLDPTILNMVVLAEARRADRLQTEIFADLRTKPFSISSGVQLGKHLKALGIVSPLKTEGGAESWSIEALKLLVNPPPVVKKIIEWKSAFSVKNTLGRNPILPAEDGRVRPRWLSMGWTGNPRIYSEKPCLTNLPRAARTAITAPPGHLWMMAQWREPEVRVIAALSGDENMTRLLNTEFDFHTTVGATINGRKPGEGTAEDRAFGKLLTYAVLDMGAYVPAMAARLGVTENEAQAGLDAYSTLFPKVVPYLERLGEGAKTAWTVTSHLNREWHLPLATIDDDDDYRQAAVVTVMQHTVATLLKIALGLIHGQAEMKHPALTGFGHVIPVFDTLYYTIAEEVSVPQHVAYLRKIWQSPFHEVIMLGDYGVGATWGDIVLIEQEAFAQVLADFGS